MMETIDEVIGGPDGDLEMHPSEDVTPHHDDKVITDMGSGDDGGLPHGGATIASNEEEVIGLLLAQQNGAAVSEASSSDMSGTTLLTTSVDASSLSGMQAITLADGTTAYIQGHQDKDGKFQTVQLVDGSTAIVQAMPEIREKIEVEPPAAIPKFVDGQAVQLEDGSTAYIHHTHKEGLQAVQLEDGSTAYIAHNPPENLFVDSAALDPNSLNLEQLASQVPGEENQPDAAASIKAAVLATTPVNNNPVTVRISSDRALALGDKAFKCMFEGCGRLYTTQHHLKVHERSHTGDRPFKCEFAGCGKAFATGYGLKSHTRVHTGEKPYRCPEESCAKSFKTSGDLQKHVRTHTGERPFKCPFEGCGRSFTTSNIRKVHIRTHTGERPYICEESGCGRAFASATNYKNHIRIHTGEKPYVCTVQGCGKRFTEYSSLYKHHVVHTHSKPYVCNHCGKNYRQTSTLAMHKRTAHGEDTTPESEAQLFAQQQQEQMKSEADDEVNGPPEKRARIQPVPVAAYQINQALTNSTAGEEEDGTLVINTADPPQVTMVTNDGMVVTDDSGMVALQATHQVAQMAIQQLQQQQGITLGDQEQQIYVVTDPAQLEALQQFAAQQQFGQVTTQITAALPPDPAISSVLTQDTDVDVPLTEDSSVTADLSPEGAISLTDVSQVEGAELISQGE